MRRISARDHEAILEIVTQVASGSAAEPVSRETLAAIRRLIPCDTLAFFDGSPWDRSRRRILADGTQLTFTPEESEIVDRFRYQLPLWPTPATVGRAMRVSDFMSRSAYRSLDLYRLFGRRHGIEFSMSYWMQSPDGVVRGLTFDASARDFRDRDVAVANVLGRHLGTVLARYDSVPPLPAPVGLTARQAQILARVASGRTNAQIARDLSLSPHTVRKHLENSFARMGVHTRAEAVAAASRTPESPSHRAAS